MKKAVVAVLFLASLARADQAADAQAAVNVAGDKALTAMNAVATRRADQTAQSFTLAGLDMQYLMYEAQMTENQKAVCGGLSGTMAGKLSAALTFILAAEGKVADCSTWYIAALTMLGQNNYAGAITAVGMANSAAADAQAFCAAAKAKQDQAIEAAFNYSVYLSQFGP